MEASPSSPGQSPEPRDPRPAFRKPAHDTSQRNYRRRSPSASASPSPPPAALPGGWKRDRSVSPSVAGDGGIIRSQDHTKKERRLYAENDVQRDAESSRFRKGDSGPGPSEAPHRGHTNDSFARPDDHDYSRRVSSHHDRTYSSHSMHSGRDLHGDARIDFLSRQDGRLDADHRSQDRGYRDRLNDRRRGKDYDRERDRNRNRDRESGRENWERSRDRERDRDRDRGRDWGKNADVDQDRDKDRSRVEKVRTSERDQLKSRDDYRDRDRRRDRAHKDVEDNRGRQDEGDRLREKSDQRDRAVRGENRERDHYRHMADSRRQTRQREGEDHGLGHHNRRPSGLERPGKGTGSFGRPSELESDDHGGGGIGWDRRAGNNEPTACDGEKNSGGSDVVRDGQLEVEKQSKLLVDGVKDLDTNDREQHSEGQASPSKTGAGESQHDGVGAQSAGPVELASTSHAKPLEADLPELESKKTGGEVKLSKSTKWGPGANVKSDSKSPAASVEASNDLSVAKLAALKAAEMVNKNLGVAGVISADQKKKLLWGSKRKECEQSSPNQEPAVLAGTNRWDTVHFADRDRQEKFHKLMGVKGDHKEGGEREVGLFTEEKQRELQQDLEKQFTAGLRRRDGRTVGLGL